VVAIKAVLFDVCIFTTPHVRFFEKAAIRMIVQLIGNLNRVP